jgi:predicted ArsR family transcriptional regulator
MNKERNLEQIYRSAVAGLYARIRSNYDFLYRKFGDDGIKLIAEMSREYGRSVADRARDSLENNDIESVAAYLMRIFDTVTHGRNTARLTREGEGKIVITASRCPLGFDNPEMCKAHTTMEKTMVEELNPDLKYSIGKSMPAGDDRCEHVIEVRKRRRTNSTDRTNSR